MVGRGGWWGLYGFLFRILFCNLNVLLSTLFSYVFINLFHRYLTVFRSSFLQFYCFLNHSTCSHVLINPSLSTPLNNQTIIN